MAFISTITGKSKLGPLEIRTGTYTSNSSSTGGDIDTGLKGVKAVFLQPKGTAILANQPVVNETLPKTGADVTIVTTADEIGTWIAVGI